MAPNLTVCSCCNKSFDAISMLKCCICKKFFKNTCVEITSTELRVLNANKGYDWSCKNCRSIGNDIKELKGLIIKLQEDIQALRASHEEVRPTNDLGFFEEVVAEVADRAKRQSNLIVFGVTEQDQSVGKDERIRNDKQEISEILRIIRPNFDMLDMNPIRLGKFVAGKNRPIKIKLGNEQQVVDIIRNVKNLVNSRFHKKVSLSFDRTIKQQALYRRVKEELQERLNSGETNLKIKYINNLPTIVPKN